MMRWALSAFALVVGCGSDAPVPTRDFSAAPIAQVTSQGGLSIAVRSSPSPVARGLDAFELTIARQGAPVDGLTVAVDPWMAAHGHGSSVKPAVTAEGGGRYLVERVSLFMPGRWTLRVQLGPGDRADIDVDVP